ncbi:MAG: hypothetical protein HY858_14395 [Candidatus Solibacter usitatus]|nr:hypothetical protein [Candidatus Solibacter usitatus]
MARRDEIVKQLSSYAAPGVDRREVAFIVLGCMSLDWDGLTLTEKLGYRQAAAARPDGRYVPYAEEKSGLSQKGMFWGSHSNTHGQVRFTSFGDPDSVPRRSLPDLEYRLAGSEFESLLPQAVHAASWRDRNSAWEKPGLMLLSLRNGDLAADQLARTAGMPVEDARRWLEFLVRIEYVQPLADRFRLSVPVLARRDKPLVKNLRGLGRDVITRWLRENYEALKGDIGPTAPTRNGVAYAEGFTMIWHHLFAATNRKLVETGLFADPYATSRSAKGFIPAVLDESID